MLFIVAIVQMEKNRHDIAKWHVLSCTPRQNYSHWDVNSYFVSDKLCHHKVPSLDPPEKQNQKSAYDHYLKT